MIPVEERGFEWEEKIHRRGTKGKARKGTEQVERREVGEN